MRNAAERGHRHAHLAPENTPAIPVRSILLMRDHKETAKEAVKKFLEKLDRFHLMAQKVFGVGFAAYNRDQSSTSQTQAARFTNNTAVLSVIESPNAPKMTNYWLGAFIALIYGTLGLSTLMGIFVYAWCTGRAKEVGWKNIFLDNVLSGNKLLHFMAHLACMIGGITGMVTAGLSNQDQDSVYYLRFVLPVFLFFASVLNTRAMAGGHTENAAVSSNSTSSPRVPHGDAADSGRVSPAEHDDSPLTTTSPVDNLRLSHSELVEHSVVGRRQRRVQETEPAFTDDHNAIVEPSAR